MRVTNIAAHRLPWFIVALAVLTGRSAAQSLAVVPSGTHYRVSGEFQGEPMAPWEATITTRDSAVGTNRVMVLTRHTNRGNGATFEATALIDVATGRVRAVSGWNRGRAVGEYRLQLEGGRMTGTDNEGGTAGRVDVSLDAAAIPDFALGHVLAASTLADGASIAASVFTYSRDDVRRYPFSAVVRSGEFKRDGADVAEPVWIVAGGSGYAARVTVAKSDRRVLEILLPQGTIGSQTDTFVGVIKP